MAQGRDIPMHRGDELTVKALLERIPAARMRDGDVGSSTFPRCAESSAGRQGGAARLLQGRLVAFAVNLARWADLGGAVPSSYVTWATESHQEELRMAPVRIFAAAGPEPETIEPHPVEPARPRGARGRSSPSTRRTTWRPAGSPSCSSATAPRRSRAPSSASTPSPRRGCARRSGAARRRVEGKDWLDDDGIDEAYPHPRPHRQARSHATFDFSGSDHQVRGPVNTTSS